MNFLKGLVENLMRLFNHGPDAEHIALAEELASAKDASDAVVMRSRNIQAEARRRSLQMQLEVRQRRHFE